MINVNTSVALCVLFSLKDAFYYTFPVQKNHYIYYSSKKEYWTMEKNDMDLALYKLITTQKVVEYLQLSDKTIV